jgi:hypothetical protein
VLASTTATDGPGGTRVHRSFCREVGVRTADRSDQDVQDLEALPAVKIDLPPPILLCQRFRHQDAAAGLGAALRETVRQCP